MVKTWYDQFVSNIRFWYSYATAWSASVWFTVLAAWGAIGREAQEALLGGFVSPGIVAFLLALFALVSHIVAKGWPQPELKAKVEAADVAEAVATAHGDLA